MAGGGGAQRSTTRSSSSAPASPGSAPRSSSTRPVSATSSCSRRATGSAARGTGTPTPGSPSTSRRSATSSRSRSAATGRGCTRPGHELKAYAEHCVDKYGVRDRIRLNTKVVGADLRRGARTPGGSRPPTESSITRALRDRRDGGVQPAEAARHPAASRRSPGPRCTPRAGITRWTCAASASP